MRKLYPLLLALLFVFVGFSVVPETTLSVEIKPPKLLPDDKARDQWVDSVMNTLDTVGRIAQMYMIDIRPGDGWKHLAEAERLVKEHKVGGLILFKGEAKELTKLTNRYQELAEIPLMVSIDGEWGLAMRVTDVIPYPYQISLGAVNNDSLIFEMGKLIGKQCRRMGIHVNFGPVVDINSNPDNPIIGYRSFGEDRDNVSRKGIMYALGMQAANVIACAKHFPGHGDTEVDSHLDLPVIKSDKKQLEEVELYPFKQLFQAGVMSTMVAHMSIPALDNRKNMPTSLSEKVINGLLKTDMGFEGLVFTDALNMKGVAKYYAPGEVDLKAFLAGNDILLHSENVTKGISLIKQSIDSGEVSYEYLNQKVRKILEYKYWLGLNHYAPAKLDNLDADLNSPEVKLLIEKLFVDQITVLNNDKALLPLSFDKKKKIASVAVGEVEENAFQKMMANYATADYYQISKNGAKSQFDDLYNKLKKYDIVIVSLHATSRYYTRNYGVTDNSKAFINQVNSKLNAVFVNFGNPYSMGYFPKFKTVVMAYEDREEAHKIAAQTLFGAISPHGCVPVSASKYYHAQCGSRFYTSGIFTYMMPEELGISTEKLSKIDAIAEKAISSHATPGCQVLVAKDGKVIYQKSYGYHTYDNKTAVQNSDVYDLASLTKILSTTLAVMKLKDEGVLDLDAKLATYIPELATTNKKNITVRQCLKHEAGFAAWLPFYTSTIGANFNNFYATNRSDAYPTQVAGNMYLKKGYEDVIYQEIYDSPLPNKGKYVYSDLSFFMLKKVVENITKQPLDEYMEAHFYTPLRLAYLGYHPLQRFNKNQIPPTENDHVFRKQLVQGYVHDQGTAMLGGMAGHAGLFSNANDVAIIMQMLLNGGEYGGVSFIRKETVEEFTKKDNNISRRGLGFDKPEVRDGKASPASSYMSGKGFGHQGFTGTVVWADPEYNLVYVFLSNRVYPDASVNKLASMGTRTDIQDAIYQAILNK